MKQSEQPIANTIDTIHAPGDSLAQDSPEADMETSGVFRPRFVESCCLVAILIISAGLTASTTTPNAVSPTQTSPAPISPTLEQRELRLTRSLGRSSQFADIQHVAQEQACEQVEPPVALATPDPLFISAVRGKRVKVSFIIGTDGRVHSPLILESAGLSGDHRVLDTVRTWRYRPATCNGIPTETEGKIEFSVH
jgi:TonB family protein